MRQIVLLILAFVVFEANLASATDYYVKNGGSDGATGLSDAAAWATFNNVNNRTFAAGDRVLLKCGSAWNQQMDLHGSGTAGSKIQLTSYGTGVKPRIYRSNLAADRCVQGLGVDYWKISGLSMDTALYGILIYKDSGTTYGIEIDGCGFSNMNYLCSGPPLADYGLGIYLTGDRQDGASITNCTFDHVCIALSCQTYGFNGGVSGQNTSNNIYTANCSALYGAWGGIAGNSLTNSTIENWNIGACGLPTTWPGPAGMQFYGATNVTIRNCSIWNTQQNNTGMDGCAIDLDIYTNNVTVDGCYLAHNQGPCIEFFGASTDNKNIIFRNNLIYNNCLGPLLANRYTFWNCNPGSTGTIDFNGFYKNGVTVADYNGNMGGFNETGNNIHSTYVTAWTPVYGYLTQIEAGGNGNVWGVNGGTNYRWTGAGTGNCWTPVTGAALTNVSCGSDGETWGCTSGNGIYRYLGGNSWNSMPGLLKQISVGNVGNIWGVNPGNFIYHWVGGNWAYVPGILNQISACKDGSQNAWGCNGSSIYRFDGANWNPVSGSLSQVSANSYNSAVGINATSIWRTTNGGVNWTNIPGNLSQVSIGSDGNIWGIAPNYTIWRYVP